MPMFNEEADGGQTTQSGRLFHTIPQIIGGYYIIYEYSIQHGGLEQKKKQKKMREIQTLTYKVGLALPCRAGRLDPSCHGWSNSKPQQTGRASRHCTPRWARGNHCMSRNRLETLSKPKNPKESNQTPPNPKSPREPPNPKSPREPQYITRTTRNRQN